MPPPAITRRSFLRGSLLAGAGLTVYSGEISRHELQVVRRDAPIPGLPRAFNGVTVAQLSDIHLDEFTEPWFLRHAVARINSLRPDLIFLTGDYVTHEIGSLRFARGAAWQCANILLGLKCRQIYAVLGNHDVQVGAEQVTAALTANGIRVLRNSYLPLQSNGSRIWLAGVDDPVCGRPNPELAIPPPIRNIPGEPVVLLCHAPDYVRSLAAQPAGQAVSLVLCGHTHGGQVRMPLLGALVLPPGGKLYPEGEFRVGPIQLYVNRGLGTVGIPFRFDCPPEITLHTLRSA